MLNVFLTSLSLVAPLLLLVLTGIVLKRLNYLSDATVNEVSKVILRVLLPLQIFMNIYNGDIPKDLDMKFLIVLIGSSLLAITINTIILTTSKIDYRQKSAMLQNATRPNASIFALPLSVMIAGDAVSSLAAMAVGFTTPIANGYAIGEFEYYKPGKAPRLKIFIRIITSPIIVATILAFIFKGFSLTLPTVISKTFTYMANIVTGMSLIVVGASFKFEVDLKKIKLIIYTIVFKTMICPIIAILLAIIFKLNATQMVVIMCISAAPIATSSFPTAKGYDTDIDLVSSTLVYSYVACSFTLTIIISVLKLLSLI